LPLCRPDDDPCIGTKYVADLQFSIKKSFFLKEEHRLRVFENRALRRVFGPKRDEVTGEWRKLHNEELMICTPYQISCGW
jgi:hypothetical protein